MGLLYFDTGLNTILKHKYRHASQTMIKVQRAGSLDPKKLNFPEDPANMPRDCLSPRLFSADLVLGTSCKGFIKGQLHDIKKQSNYSWMWLFWFMESFLSEFFSRCLDYKESCFKNRLALDQVILTRVYRSKNIFLS